MAAVPSTKLSDQLMELKPELEKVLPAHVSVDKFMRVINTAISMNPDLYNADRRSLFTSCVKCATDGLLPDGREAALVIFNSKEKYTENGQKKERWLSKVQYMPMFAGLQKKVRNSGELKELICEVVLQADAFRYWIDDAGAHLTHEPNMEAEDRGRFKAVYCIAKTHDGGVYTEVMSKGQVEKVRQVSKSKDNGPWVGWFDEMARKTVFRRLSKRLPMSTDIEQVIRRDDNLYELAKPGRAALADSSSGVSAAKALLGIGSPSALLDTPPESDESQADGEGESDYVPHFGTESAIAELKKMTGIEALEKTWVAINFDYDESDRQVHPDIEDCYKACKQVLLAPVSK